MNSLVVHFHISRYQTGCPRGKPPHQLSTPVEYQRSKVLSISMFAYLRRDLLQ